MKKGILLFQRNKKSRRGHHELLYANKLDNLVKMNKFLERQSTEDKKKQKS